TLADVTGARRASIWTLRGGGRILLCEDSFDRETNGHVEGLELHRDELPGLFRHLLAGEEIEAADAARDRRTVELNRVLSTVSDLGQLVSELQGAASNVKNLSRGMNARDGGVPGLLHRADATLATLQQSMRDLALATQRAPQIVHNVEMGARDLPGLLTQTQQTAHQLEELAIQLRGVWLLGG